MPARRRDKTNDLSAWRSYFAGVSGDIAGFSLKHFRIALEDGPKPLVLLPHQERILRAIFTPPYPSEAVYSTIKKSGKSATSALVGLYVACCIAPPETEIICAANDEEQAASRVFRDIKYAVEQHPDLSKLATVTDLEIALPNGVTIKAISSDYASASGSRHALAIFDELWAYTSERSQRLYDELTAVPTLTFSMRFVASSAGFEGESKTLKGLYDRGMKGERVFTDLPVYRNGALLMYWDEGEEARRMPWQQGERGETYYAQESESLRPGQYQRLHENRWAAGVEAFITAELYDSNVNAAARPFLMGDPDLAHPLFVGVDVGTKHDSSAIAVVERLPGRLRLVMHRIAVPLPGQPVQIEEEVENYLRQLLAHHRVKRVRFDPYQLAQAGQRLVRDGFHQVEEYSQTSPNLTAMGNSLTEVLRGRRIELYADEEIRRAALRAVAVESGRGWRIAKERAKDRIDIVVALAMAVHAALTEIPVHTASTTVEPDPYYRVPQAHLPLAQRSRVGAAGAARWN